MEIMPIFAQKIPFGRVKCYNGRSAVFCAPQTAPGIVRLTASGRAMRKKSAPRSLAYHGETGTDVRCTSRIYYNKPPPRFASIFFIFFFYIFEPSGGLLTCPQEHSFLPQIRPALTFFYARCAIL